MLFLPGVELRTSGSWGERITTTPPHHKKIFIAVLQIITSASAGACRQVNPDSSKYLERRSMNLCLLPELDKNCDFFTVSAV